MKLIKKLVCATVVAASMIGTAQAGPVLQNWVLNPGGAAAGGFAGGSAIHEYLDIIGNGFIQLTATSGSTFNFVEHATFRVPGFDGTFNFPNNQYVTATFEATGSGSFSGAFQFSGGTIKMYANNVSTYGTAAGIYGADQGTLIANIGVLAGGGGLVDGSGNPISNGQVTVFAKATTPGGLTPGYFFRGNGSDLANEDILAFAFTDANGISNVLPGFVKEVACQWAGFTPGPLEASNCATGSYTATSGRDIIVSNNGSFKLAEVPEPDSLALFGIAMLGVGFVSRKRSKKA